MSDVLLRFYLPESRKHGHRLLYEWLLEEAKRLGIAGGSAFRGIAGFGRRGVLHEEHFFELAGDLPVVVELALTAPQAQALLDLLAREGIRIPYVNVPVAFGVSGG